MPVLDKRLELGHLPTPLERADKLTDFLAGPRIFIKRDDATGWPEAATRSASWNTWRQLPWNRAPTAWSQ